MMTFKSTHFGYLLFFLSLLYLPHLITAQELVQQLPTVFIEDIQDIAVSPEGYGVAIASRGKILLTNDNGQNWAERPGVIQNTTRIEAIPGQSQGFILLQRTAIWRTSDGGENWEGLTIPELSVANPRIGIISLPTTQIFYVASREDVMKSSDGGDTWSLITPPIMDRIWVEMQFISETMGWLTDDTGVLHYTNNGGASWTVRNDTSFEEGFAFDFMDANMGYAGLGRDLYRTTDGGITWAVHLVDAFGGTVSQVEMIDEEHGICSQLALSNYVTTDGAQTMERIAPLGYGGNHGYVHAFSDGQVWATTDHGGIAYSTDFGVTYVDQIPGIKHGFLGIDISADNSGWAVGRGGQAVRTTNGGNDWELVPPLPNDPVDNEPSYVDYVDSYSYTEALIGASRQILYTNDGGNSWEVRRNAGDNDSFDDITTVGNTIWALESNGDGGVVHRSLDKGLTWETFSIDSQGFISIGHIEFYDQNIGFVAGFSGNLFKTIDGGESWTRIEFFESSDRLLAPVFQSEQEGWLLKDGYGEEIFHTTDGGNSWESILTGNPTFWGNIQATENGVYVFGGSSGVGRGLRSFDGGQTWELFLNGYVTSYTDYAYRETPNGFTYWVCGYGAYIGVYDNHPVGVREQVMGELSVYPNPTNGSLQLDLPEGWEQKAQLTVYNLQGQALLQQAASRELQLSQLPAGGYVLTIQQGTEMYRATIILE